MEQRQNIVITRGHIGQLGSVLTGVGFLIGLIGWLWQGGFTLYIGAAFAVGIAGLVLWVWMIPGEFKDFITGRQMRHGTISFFSTLLVIGSISMVYLLVQREVLTFDITTDERFTLDDTSLEVIEAAARSTRDIQITGFYSAEEVIQREIDDQYFRLYETASEGKIRRVYIDPLEQPGIASRYSDALVAGYNAFLSYLNEDGTIDFNTTIPINNNNRQERAVTQALAQLLAAGEFKIYFERSLETLDPISNEQQGMSIINNLMRGNGLITEELSLAELAVNNGDIPQDASSLILSRPIRPISPPELAIIDRYLQSGGSLLILSDIFFTDVYALQEGSLFSDYLLENFGIRPLDQIAVDQGASGSTALDVVSAQVFTENNIGINLNIEGDPNTSTLFRLARPIEVVQHESVFNGRVIMTSPLSWGETDLAGISERNAFEFDEGEDSPGPLTTVAWAFNEDTGAKVVLIGDGEFATNGQVQSPGGNALLLLDSLGWLTGFTERITFGFQSIVTTPTLFIDGQMLDVIAFVTIILMPGIMLVAAVAIWARRMRAS